MNISIICPVYNGERYIESLDKSIKLQKGVDVNSIEYVLTESNDSSEEILKKINACYKKIMPNEFSHSLTREKEAMISDSDIIVFISQDIKIESDKWLYNLTKDIINGNCEAAFSRQICQNNSIERYIRKRNYPDKSRIVSKNDVDRLGLMTFFFSDASSAIRKDIFIKLNGYDNKRLIINEDMYFAYKLIMNGYKIKYCADSVVIHSHIFTYKQLYKRYFNTGVFFVENSYLDGFSTSGSGFSLARYIYINALKDKNFEVVLNVLPNFAARYIGLKMGRNYRRFSKKKLSIY